MPSGLWRGRDGEEVKYVPDYEKPILWMLLTAVIFVIMTAACFLTNPSLLYDFVHPVELNTSVNPYFVKYDTAFGNHVMSGMVYAEQWRNGSCVRSAPVSLNQYAFVPSLILRLWRRQGMRLSCLFLGIKPIADYSGTI